MICPECGYTMNAFDKKCPRCQGKGLAQTQPLSSTTPPSSLDIATQPTVPLQSGNNPAVAPPAIAATPPVPIQQCCHRCGTKNSGLATFCGVCGQSLTTPAPIAAPPSVTAPPANSGWGTSQPGPPTQPVYPPQPYQQAYTQQTYPAQAYQPPYQHQQQPYQQPYPPQPYPPLPYQPPLQNNVNVAVTQQHTDNSLGWLVALLVILFGTPLGCLAVPLVLVLMVLAFPFAPMIIAVIATAVIAKSPMDQDKKTLAILVSLGIGVIANLALLGKMHS